MKKIVIILSVLVLISGGCKQTTKKQVETESKTIIKTDTAYQEDMSGQTKDIFEKLSENHKIRSLSADCETPDRKILLKYEEQKKDFSLILAFCDENIERGYVLYYGQTEPIPIQFDHEEILEDRSEEGRPNVRNLFYNEIYHSEINGLYVLTLQGVRFYGAYYLRKKDNKKIDLKVIDDLYE